MKIFENLNNQTRQNKKGWNRNLKNRQIQQQHLQFIFETIVMRQTIYDWAFVCFLYPKWKKWLFLVIFFWELLAFFETTRNKNRRLKWKARPKNIFGTTTKIFEKGKTTTNRIQMKMKIINRIRWMMNEKIPNFSDFWTIDLFSVQKKPKQKIILLMNLL